MQATATARRLLRNFQTHRKSVSLLQKIRRYRAHVPICQVTGDFIIKTADSGPELLKVLELRHQVFIEEWQGRKTDNGLDVDRYDFLADHLMLIDRRMGETIGTYRLLSSHFTDDFYSQSEFDLSRFTAQSGVKLEVGRGCVHRDYRDGNGIDLLWKGLTRYTSFTGTKIIFGCTSVKSTDSSVISSLYQSLHQEHHWSDDFGVRPHGDFQFPGFPCGLTGPMSPKDRREHMPALLRSYLHAGARVYGWPALDREFNCTDLFTVLDWRYLHPRFKARYATP